STWMCIRSPGSRDTMLYTTRARRIRPLRPSPPLPTRRMTPGLLKRNTLLNLAGQGAPIIVAVVAIPFITRAMGPERFGVLALAWTFIGYFAVFDIGLGRSLTQRVAELLGEGEDDQIPMITWVGSTMTFALGVI